MIFLDGVLTFVWSASLHWRYHSLNRKMPKMIARMAGSIMYVGVQAIDHQHSHASLKSNQGPVRPDMQSPHGLTLTNG